MEKANKKVNAAIVIIGNEILSGRTQEVNVVLLSKWLNKLGVKVEEVRVVPDLENSIVNTVNELRKKFNYIFTTGGIGPTHSNMMNPGLGVGGYCLTKDALFADVSRKLFFSKKISFPIITMAALIFSLAFFIL